MLVLRERNWYQYSIFMTPDFFSTSHFSRFNSFFSLIFFLSFCICTALVQDQVINFLPVGVSFRLIINQFIWIWLFLTSFRAEVCEEQEWRVGLTYVPTTACIYAVVLRQGNVMETDTPNRRGYECQSTRTFENFSSNAQLRGAFSSTFTRFSLVRPPQSY